MTGHAAVDAAPSGTRPRPSRRGERRVAIVGGGPRGFQALERLHAHIRMSDAAHSIRVDVFEPRDRIGSGPNYHPAQPDVLRMNYAAEHVDAWLPPEPRDDVSRPPLTRWLEGRHPEWADGASFPPRARVGQYLEWCAGEVLEALRSQGCAVRHRQERIRAVEPAPESGRWRLRGEDRIEDYDEVLLTTGHASSRSDGFARAWEGRINHVVHDVYRDDALHPPPSLAHTGRGPTVVALRGFALTSIDAMLLLTEDRGGRFETRPAGRARYVPPGTGRVRLVPFSRTGRPMLAKPDPDRVRPTGELGDVWAVGRDAILAAPDLPGLRAVVVSTAGRALARSRGCTGSERATIARRVASTMDEVLTPHRNARGPVTAELERSVDVATGRAPVDARWALGEAWRRLYPAVVEWVARRARSAESRRSFAWLGRGMERIAFGPPVATAVRLLALEAAGVLDLRFASDPELSVADEHLVLSLDGRRTRVDMLVDAVSPAPGIDGSSDLLGRLLGEGLVRLVPGTHGLAIDDGGRPLGPAGGPLPGLAVVGRAAEGAFVGFDTLSRTLHGHLDTWARRVVTSAGVDVERSLP